MSRKYNAMSYREAHSWEDQAKKRGVSKVARSQRGFMRAYEEAGSFSKLPQHWKEKRRNFIARHMAQANDEDLWKNGKPSRRALALIMWAYMPPGRSKKNPSPTSSPRRVSRKTLVCPTGFAWVVFDHRKGNYVRRTDYQSADQTYPNDGRVIYRKRLHKDEARVQFLELKRAGWVES